MKQAKDGDFIDNQRQKENTQKLARKVTKKQNADKSRFENKSDQST